MGTDIPKVSLRHQIDIIQAFVADSSFAEMKNKRALIEKQGNSRASLEKLNVSKQVSPRLGSDRYGHLIRARGGASSKTISSERSHSGEPDESEARSTDALFFETPAVKSPLRCLLIPIDATHVKPPDIT